MRLCFSSILCGVCELFPWEYVAIWCWISLERPLTYLPNEDYGVTDARWGALWFSICASGGQWRFSSVKGHLVQPYILCQNSCLSDNNIVPSNAFYTVLRVLGARIVEWFDIPFSSGPCFVKTLHHDPSILGGPHGMAQSFIEGCDPCDHFG